MKTGNLSALAWALYLVSLPAVAQTTGRTVYMISSIAGSNEVGDGELAVRAQLGNAEGLALDGRGNLFIADALDNRVRSVNLTTGIIQTVTGNGHLGFSGDGGPAVSGQLSRPYGVAADSAGNVYVADYGNRRIRRIGADGNISTVVGGGVAGAPEPLSARLTGPRNVAVDSSGNLYIAEFDGHQVLRLGRDGRLTRVAGTGSAGYNGEGLATEFRLNFPAGLAVDRDDALLIADSGNHRVRRLHGGLLTTVIGPQTVGEKPVTPTGVAVGADGVLYVADGGRKRVLRRAVNGQVTALGEGRLLAARDVAVDSLGRVYVAGSGVVWRLSPTGELAAVAGDGRYGKVEEGGPATRAYLNGPTGVAVDITGNVYISEPWVHRVRRLRPSGALTTVAGTGERGASGDGGPATMARLIDPVGVAADRFGNLYIGDGLGHRVRRVAATGVMTTLAGNGQAGSGGDFHQAALAQLNRPEGLAVDSEGNLYIADAANHRVRRVSWNGFITTVAGNGLRGYAGDGGAAAQALLDSPSAVAMDAHGNLYIADSGNHVIRRVGAEGIIRTIAGVGTRGFSGDGGRATLAALNGPAGVAADGQGNVYIADTGNHRIREIDPEGRLRTIAGDGFAGFSGDGGPAAEARLRNPRAVATDGEGNIFVADTENNRVRKLVPVGVGTMLAHSLRVTHAATFAEGPMAPGQLVALFGQNLGPPNGAGAKLNTSGNVDSQLAETEVRFGGRPAPLLFVSESQVNTQLPFEVSAGGTVEVEVYYQGLLRGRAWTQIAAAAPALFTHEAGRGAVLAINEDGGMNSETQPAPRGSVVSLYLTGGGETDPPGVTGQPAPPNVATLRLPVRVTVSGLAAEVTWAGSAPGLVGVTQVNARLPGPFSPTGVLPLTVTVGSASSQPGVTISVR